MHPITLLLFATLIAVLALAVALYLHHMRKASNRHPMEGIEERDIKAGEPPKDGRH